MNPHNRPEGYEPCPVCGSCETEGWGPCSDKCEQVLTSQEDYVWESAERLYDDMFLCYEDTL